MASKYLQNYPIPQDFNQILADFTREILRDQPEDIIEYAAQYFEALQAGKKWTYESKTNVPNPNPQSHYVAQPREKEPQQQPQAIAHKREPSQSQEKSFQSETSHKEEKQITKGYLADLEKDVLVEAAAELESKRGASSKDLGQKSESRVEENKAASSKELETSKFDEEELYDDQEHKYLTLANGERLAYREAGEENSEYIILLHGLLSSSEMWTPIIPALAEKYHVFAIDLRGSGHSTYRSKIFHMRDLADDIVQFMEALEIETASFIGHFTGAAVAMTLAFRYTYKVKKLIVLEPLSIKGFIYGGKEAKDYQAEDFASHPMVSPVVEALKTQNTGYFKDMLVSSYFSGNPPAPGRLDVLVYDAFRCKSYLDLLYVMSRHNISNESNGIVEGNGGISLIESDVLIIHGLDDRVASLEASKTIQEVLGPKAELITIEGGAHAILDADPQGISNNIIEFLEKAPSIHKFIKLPNGETIAYTETGVYNEKVVVCLHGNLASSQNWDILFPKLEGDFNLIAVDLRGFGRSSYNTKIQDLRDFAEDIEAFLEAKQLDKATFFGDFIGAGIALLIAIRKPELVEKLILMGPISSKGFIHKIEGVDDPQPEDFLKDPTVNMIHNALVSHNRDFFWEALSETMTSEKGAVDEGRYAAYLDDIFLCRAYLDVLYAMSRFNISTESNGIVDGTGEISKVEAQALILQGEHDKLVSADAANKLTEELGDKAKLEIIAGASHSFLESHLDHTANLVKSFLNSK